MLSFLIAHGFKIWGIVLSVDSTSDAVGVFCRVSIHDRWSGILHGSYHFRICRDP